jgi:predicted SAM-dependent methyltransferase
VTEGVQLTIKSSVKKLAQPVMGRFYARTENVVQSTVVPIASGLETRQNWTDKRLDESEERLRQLTTDIEAFSRYLPTVINTIASQNATARTHERQMKAMTDQMSDMAERVRQVQAAADRAAADTAERMEFIRREMLYEQRYEGEPRTASEPSEPSVLNRAKLEAMGDRIRLNVGAGHVAKDEYLNVDVRELPGIDVVADIRDLPFDPEEVDEIYSSHVLEHFPVEELHRKILPTWVSLLKDGGTFVAVVPDVTTMVKETAAGNMPFGDFIRVMYGDQEYEGDFHFAGYTQESLAALLEGAGLSDVVVREAGRRNGACFEMEIEATRRLHAPD